MLAQQPYRGTIPKLVLGIDIGTTYSGVAYAFLDPGETPRIHSVTRFPGQEHAASDSKIPSMMYYYPNGTVHSAGAEAMRPGIELEVIDSQLVLVEWFKMHLSPDSLQSVTPGPRRVTALPPGKTIVNVLADFLLYLLSCTRRFVAETHANGESLWASVQTRMEFVLSHPNGWGGPQQAKMRQAAVLAGLISDDALGHARITFVTEGEASLNFCIRSGLTADVLRDGKSVIIVDAGGGTIDISSYVFRSVSPVKVEEVTSPDCILQGSVFVTARAEQELRKRLGSSMYGNDDDIKSMINYFDTATKPVFKSNSETSYIKFGSMRCNDLSCNIRRGQLLLSGSDMVSFFRPSLDSIVKVVLTQRANSKSDLSTVFLVGGFAASPWLYANLKEELNKRKVTLYRPDSHTNKAVAIGAVCFHLDHIVSARVMRMTYGTRCSVEYDDEDPEHRSRRHVRYTRPSGSVVVPGSFYSILEKGARVRENEEVSKALDMESTKSRTLNSISTEVLCYTGRDPDPRWTDMEPELFTALCTIHADTSQVRRKRKMGPDGAYYVQEFEIVLLCGTTELKAQIRWKENGVERRGPAKIVYEDDLIPFAAR
ncbi:hypothetical protein C8Q76DRAFT_820418 [Earliella scabrosa]|nr:hypothetical protein C8Q76DRAFT_820418 [Earliella scabrosa]